jgi:sugar O-acyltransferase (sialic acid O-acetyltransferase NeuD family)
VKPLVIFGAGDIARLAHHYFTRDAGRAVVGFTVDPRYRTSETFLGLPLHPFPELPDRCPPEDHELFVALSHTGMNRVRAEKYEAAKRLGYTLPSYVSSRCSFLTDTPVGENCFILEDNTIQPFVRIGNDVTLWSGNHVGHDSVIEDHCFVSSHVVIAGRVRIGPYCFLGVNATLRNGITIAPRTLVGAGAVVMRDTEEDSVHLPAPSRLSRRPSGDVGL